MNNLTTNAPIQLKRDPDGRLYIHSNPETWTPVTIRPCFPWSRPGTFLSLRDAENREYALIPDPENLPDPSRTALLEALRETRFTFTIQSVIRVENDFELRVWSVKTAQGQRSFCTKTDDWPRRLDDGRVVFTDLGGDLFVIENLENMDKHSRRLLWSYVA